MHDKNNFIPITNRFAFADVFSSDMKLAADFISVLIGREVSKVVLAEKEKQENITSFNRGVRFDVYLKDEEGRSFDLELQLYQEKYIKKRSRYYHSMISAYSLLKGDQIKDLKDSYVIFIFPDRDPLGKGETVYEIRSRLKDGSEYDDGVYTYLFNFSDNRKKTNNEQIEELAEYFYNGVVVEKSLSGRIEEIIEQFNRQENWRSTMMTLEQEMKMVEARGREEGKAEGLAEGRELGLVEGKAEGIKGIIVHMLKLGKDADFIAENTGIDRKTIDEIAEEFSRQKK